MNAQEDSNPYTLKKGYVKEDYIWELIQIKGEVKAMLELVDDMKKIRNWPRSEEYLLKLEGDMSYILERIAKLFVQKDERTN